ncbi:Hypothetical protein CINCED_3A003137 [Cinara cedri]|uniref:Uncharacterized protein n=1 Tax=Cinara cedri TaxID=506608 RepID=A0A5E4MUH4_9HEMI|nr:Hypothetical protein CINCED_3A003137 [Cinara cedri]
MSFSEGVSVLKSFQIPDLGNCILFFVGRALFTDSVPHALRVTAEKRLSDRRSCSRLSSHALSSMNECRVSHVSLCPLYPYQKSKERISTSPKRPHKPLHTSLVSTPLLATSTD